MLNRLLSWLFLKLKGVMVKRLFLVLIMNLNVFCADDYKSLQDEPLDDVVGSLSKPGTIINGNANGHVRASSEAIHNGGLVGSLLADAEIPQVIPDKPFIKHVLELIVMKKKCGCFSSFTEHDKLKVQVSHPFYLRDIRNQMEGNYLADFYDYKFKKELSDKEYLEPNVELSNAVIKLYMIYRG